MLLLLLVIMFSQGFIPYQIIPNYQDRWDEAAEKIVRLSPMEFERVPLKVREEFTKLGCTIPQIPGEKPVNIVSGEFAARGQTDWAALCSRDGKSAIVVIWGGSAKCPATVEEARSDRNWLQGWTQDSIAFSRLISAFPSKYPSLFTMDGEEELPDQRTHDSIEDYFVEKGGTAFYCHEGRWIEFGTSD